MYFAIINNVFSSLGDEHLYQFLSSSCKGNIPVLSGWCLCRGAVVHKVCPADPKGSATSSQGICGGIAVMANWKYTYFLIEV